MAAETFEMEQIVNKDVNTPSAAAATVPTNTKGERVQETWSRGVHFLMSCVAMSVGLGNVWRFPFTAYENGGGAFLVPYAVALLVAGRPFYYLEATLGQFSGQRNVGMFQRLAPALKGMAYAQLFVVICTTPYYASLMAITLHYLFNSFTFTLPWSECKEEWSGDGSGSGVCCLPSRSILKNISAENCTSVLSSSVLWFEREVLKETSSIDDGIGYPDPKLCIMLAASWLLLFVITARGMTATGKFTYFFAVFPYLTMIILLVRAVTLEGAQAGLFYFLKPDWKRLTSAKVWYSAITQCFYTFNLGGGTIIMLASYNKFNHDISRDMLIIISLDSIASLLAGITIFATLGNLAFQLNVNVTQVASSGGGSRLAFVIYPEAIAKIDTVPWLLSICFFSMLFILGIGSLVSMQGTLSAAIKDLFPSLGHRHVSLMTAAGGFLIGTIYLTPGGQFILTLVDYYGVTLIIFILNTIEIVVVLWCYGANNLASDVQYMTGRKVGMYWRACWLFFTPSCMLAVLLYFFASLESITYGSRSFPPALLNAAWFITAIGVSQPILWWIKYLYERRNETFTKVLRESVSFKNWAPGDVREIDGWKQFRAEKREK